GDACRDRPRRRRWSSGTREAPRARRHRGPGCCEYTLFFYLVDDGQSSSSFSKIAVYCTSPVTRCQPNGVCAARILISVIFICPPGAGTAAPGLPRMNATAAIEQALGSCASVLTTLIAVSGGCSWTDSA